MRLNVNARNTIVSKQNAKVTFEYLIWIKQRAQNRAQNVFLSLKPSDHMDRTRCVRLIRNATKSVVLFFVFTLFSTAMETSCI